MPPTACAGKRGRCRSSWRAGAPPGTSSRRWRSPTPSAGLRPDAVVTALGTEKGLDTRLIPARGYPLELIPPVPLPRKPSGDLLRLPGKVWSAVSAVRECCAEVDADVVVGFGGYVALPAYLAARGRTPIVVHEANARAGLANKVGARFAAPGRRRRARQRAAAAPRCSASRCGASVTTLDRDALRGRPRALRPARRRPGAAGLRRLAGRPVAQLRGRRGAARAASRRGSRCCTPTAPPVTPRAARRAGYVPLPYIEDMHLAYAAADASCAGRGR